MRHPGQDHRARPRPVRSLRRGDHDRSAHHRRQGQGPQPVAAVPDHTRLCGPTRCPSLGRGPHRPAGTHRSGSTASPTVETAGCAGGRARRAGGCVNARNHDPSARSRAATRSGSCSNVNGHVVGPVRIDQQGRAEDNRRLSGTSDSVGFGAPAVTGLACTVGYAEGEVGNWRHPEEERVCKRCGRRWYAERWTKSDARQPLIGSGFSARIQDLNRQTVHQDRLQRHAYWAQCQGCGSKKVSTAKPSRTPSPPPTMPPPAEPFRPGWHPDPTSRYQLRWWDGANSGWTPHVVNEGVAGLDPL